MSLDETLTEDGTLVHPYRIRTESEVKLETGVYVATYNEDSRESNLWCVSNGMKKHVLTISEPNKDPRPMIGFLKIRALAIHKGDLIFSSKAQIHRVKDYLQKKELMASSKYYGIDYLLSQGDELSCIIGRSLFKVSEDKRLEKIHKVKGFEEDFVDVCVHKGRICYLTRDSVVIRRWHFDKVLSFGDSMNSSSNHQVTPRICSTHKGLYVTSNNFLIGLFPSITRGGRMFHPVTRITSDDEENFFYTTEKSLYSFRSINNTLHDNKVACFGSPITAVCFHKPRST